MELPEGLCRAQGNVQLNVWCTTILQLQTKCCGEWAVSREGGDRSKSMIEHFKKWKALHTPSSEVRGQKEGQSTGYEQEVTDAICWDIRVPCPAWYLLAGRTALLFMANANRMTPDSLAPSQPYPELFKPTHPHLTFTARVSGSWNQFLLKISHHPLKNSSWHLILIFCSDFWLTLSSIFWVFLLTQFLLMLLIRYWSLNSLLDCTWHSFLWTVFFLLIPSNHLASLDLVLKFSPNKPMVSDP